MAKTIVAIMYDFDKTLITTDMQNYSFIPNLDLTPAEFWSETARVGSKYIMDKILAYMYVMLDQAKKKNIKVTKDYLASLAKDVKYFKGVTTWFERLKKFGESIDVEIEHYIISSGTKEIIEATSIAKEFKEIFACEFLFDEESKEAIWPKVAINYTNKTQYVFRISKGTFDILDDEKLNSDILDEDRHVLYRNMIYIGDGITDIPCMQVVKDKGGKSIAVYDADRGKPAKLVNDERINYVCKADYQEDSALEKYVKLAIHHMVINEKLAKTETMQISRYQKAINGDKND